MSFDSEANRSSALINKNLLYNKNEYNFVLYVQDSILTTEINVKFSDSKNNQSYDGVINFASNLIK